MRCENSFRLHASSKISLLLRSACIVHRRETKYSDELEEASTLSPSELYGVGNAKLLERVVIRTKRNGSLKLTSDGSQSLL